MFLSNPIIDIRDEPARPSPARPGPVRTASILDSKYIHVRVDKYTQLYIYQHVTRMLLKKYTKFISL